MIPARRRSLTFLATPFEFVAHFPPETCIQMLQQRAIKPPLLIRLFWRNHFDVSFKHIDADTWDFFIHSGTRRGNVDAAGTLRRGAGESTVFTGVAEWNRFTYLFFIVIAIVWFFSCAWFSTLVHTWLPLVVVMLLIALVFWWNLRYMRKRAEKLIETLQEMLAKQAIIRS